MKLAEALLDRKTLRDKINDLQMRATQNAIVQEGDSPVEEPESLLREHDAATLALGVLIRRINATNNDSRLDDGTTISDAIVKRDELDWCIGTLQSVVENAQVSSNRYSRTEIKFVPTVSVSELRKQLDALSKARRELDAQIQALNWTSELAE